MCVGVCNKMGGGWLLMKNSLIEIGRYYEIGKKKICKSEFNHHPCNLELESRKCIIIREIEEDSMKKKRSLIEKSNRSGPTIEPCGMPK